jgi:predicted membrane protein
MGVQRLGEFDILIPIDINHCFNLNAIGGNPLADKPSKKLTESVQLFWD